MCACARLLYGDTQEWMSSTPRTTAFPPTIRPAAKCFSVMIPHETLLDPWKSSIPLCTESAGMYVLTIHDLLVSIFAYITNKLKQNFLHGNTRSVPQHLLLSPVHCCLPSDLSSLTQVLKLHLAGQNLRSRSSSHNIKPSFVAVAEKTFRCFPQLKSNSSSSRNK